MPASRIGFMPVRRRGTERYRTPISLSAAATAGSSSGAIARTSWPSSTIERSMSPRKPMSEFANPPTTAIFT